MAVTLLTVLAGPAVAPAGPLDAGTAVGVSEREFRISPYRRTVPPGVVRFNVRNFGEDVHDLVVISPHGRKLGTTGEISAGEQGLLRLKLNKPGVYRLLCYPGRSHCARDEESDHRSIYAPLGASAVAFIPGTGDEPEFRENLL